MEHLARYLSGESGFATQIFYGAVIVFALAEVIWPLRAAAYSVLVRWGNNIALGALNTLLSYAVLGGFAYAALETTTARSWGLLPALGVSGAAAVVVGFLWLDFVAWGSHVLLHKIPVLWRLHRVHHSDPEMDFTSSRRHHPFEVLLSASLTFLAALAAGVPFLSLMIWMSVVGVTSVYQHVNVRVPRRIDGLIRLVVITPDMHRVHHSARQPETDSNYGQLLPWWDRMFGTYVAMAEGGNLGMTIGLDEFRAPRDQYLDRLLVQPLVGSRPTGQVLPTRSR